MPITFETLTSGETLGGNRIATGEGNLPGLTNIELIAVDGVRFYPVNDMYQWNDGVTVARGDYSVTTQGAASTSWSGGFITMAQWEYLYQEICGYSLSARVTISTRRYDRDTYIDCNATLNLPQPSEIDGRQSDWFPFTWRFTDVSFVSSYGSAYGSSYGY